MNMVLTRLCCRGACCALLLVSLGSFALDNNLPVSMEFQDVPVSVILQALADHQKLNLVTSASVEGKLTLRLKEVPWQKALSIILQMGKLSQELQDNVLIISPQRDEQAERLQQKLIEEQQKSEQPLGTLNVALHYADASEVAKSLNAQRGTLLTPRGHIITDIRTNSLLIRDTEEALSALEPWIGELDLPLQQIQLTAHIVTMNSESLREIGVRWALSDPLESGKALRMNNFNVGLPVESSMVNAGFRLARINGRLLDLELSAMEQEDRVEIIASPQLFTAHMQTASIKQGTEIPYEVSSGASGSTSIEFKEAVLGMEVTPRILRNGKINLALQISQNMPGRTIKQGEGEALAIDKQEIKTQVTVANGDTIVLGGIFQKKNVDGEDKVPGLGDIPWVGSLFKRQSKQEQRRELVIFVTPTLINEG
ncbi:DNA uptake porin HofQ [Edaphovirga cremea]|uniref:DNA uptake porin HofQ n=1 Tax=Edaphovirga cremea TaxID=2267246 RepID=UPI000DEFAFCC|nr:DNA uptake porin HofQ [Edaphovirga cremea]